MKEAHTFVFAAFSLTLLFTNLHHLSVVDTTPLCRLDNSDDVAGGANAHIPQWGEGQGEIWLDSELVMWHE